MTEDAFLRRLLEEPASTATWLVLADWLEDRADPRHQLIRLRCDPAYLPELEVAGREERLRDLLGAGLAPCVPAIENSVGMRLVLLPAGTFTMGTPEGEMSRHHDEGPRHDVTLSRPFFLSAHLVTQEQYLRVRGENPSLFPESPRHPVEHVRWDDAVAFCERLSQWPQEKAAGRIYRLPTEAEWEYACRAGMQSYTVFHTGDQLDSRLANFDSNLKHPTPVGSYPPNAFGLFDMHGNLHEWCQDWFDSDYYLHIPAVDPPGPEKGSTRVLRGGSWSSNPIFCRSGYRCYTDPDNQTFLGFRVVAAWSPVVAAANAPALTGPSRDQS
jgi:uncharacterized protein (TIGR02996 family)